MSKLNELHANSFYAALTKDNIRNDSQAATEGPVSEDTVFSGKNGHSEYQVVSQEQRKADPKLVKREIL